MKKLFFILAFLTPFIGFGQKMPSDYFEEASQLFEDEKLGEALQGFKYIVENYPKNDHYPMAFYNVGYIHFLLKNYDNAINVFKEILESNFNERENLGGGIMADPYTNYRHRASEILSEIYFEKNRFDTALHYFTLSDTVYPYLHFCGNEYASNDVHTALRYADIYMKLNKPGEAIEKLLPAVFITLADNSEVIAKLKKLLANKKGLKKELDNSLDKIYSKTIERGDYTYERQYFKFLGVEIAVPNSYEYEEEKLDKNKGLTVVKQTDFYQMIKNL